MLMGVPLKYFPGTTAPAIITIPEYSSVVFCLFNLHSSIVMYSYATLCSSKTPAIYLLWNPIYGGTPKAAGSSS